MKLRLPFAPLVALRFLREGRMQTLLILAGTTGGVAVIIFLTQLISQLQAQIIDRVLGSQAHVVIRPLEEANRPAIDDEGFARIIEPRAQRLRSVDQWENIARLAADTPGVTAVSPVVTGPAFALRGQASKSVALMGVDAERYRRSVPYADPFWPYRSFPFGYPYRHPHLAPYGGVGWGIQIRP